MKTAVSPRPPATARLQLALLPSVEGILLTAIFLTVLVLGDHILRDADTAWHIRVGDYILSQGQVPRVDIFSHRKFGQEWIAHEWLADAIFAAIHRVAGLNGIVVLSAIVIAATFILLFRLIAGRLDNALISLAVTILSAITASIHWLARPHLFSLALVVIWYSALESHQRDPKRYHFFLFPVLMIIWANIHGSFLFGLALLGIYTLAALADCVAGGEQARDSRRKFISFSVIGTVCLLASLLNPYGYRLLLFPLEILTAAPAMSTISEWQSPDFHRFGSYELYLLLLVLTFLARKASIRLLEAALILFSIHMSLVARRYIPIFAILMAPVLAARLDDWYRCFAGSSRSTGFFSPIKRGLVIFVDRFQSFNSSLRSHVVPLAVVLVATTAALNGGKVFGRQVLAYEFSGPQYPVRAVEFLKKHAPMGNMFNYYSYGGYLIYAFFPDPRYRVYVDGRAIVGGADYYTDYLDVVYLSSRWKELLDRDHVNWIIYPAQEGFSVVLRDNPAWKLVYTDEQTSIFRRVLTPTRQPDAATR